MTSFPYPTEQEYRDTYRMPHQLSQWRSCLC